MFIGGGSKPPPYTAFCGLRTAARAVSKDSAAGYYISTVNTA